MSGSSTTRINDLPRDVLLELFKNVSHYDLMKNVKFVCRRWYETAQDKSLFRDVVINNKWISNTGIKYLLTTYTDAVQTIKIVIGEETNFAMILISHLPNLKTLVVSNMYNRSHAISFTTVMEIFQNCRRLETIMFNDLRIAVPYTAIIDELNDSLGGTLKRLILKGCNNYYSLSDPLRDCRVSKLKGLQELVIEDSQMTLKTIKEFVKNNANTVTKLELRVRCHLGEPQLEYIVREMKKCHKVETGVLKTIFEIPPNLMQFFVKDLMIKHDVYVEKSGVIRTNIAYLIE